LRTPSFFVRLSMGGIEMRYEIQCSAVGIEYLRRLLRGARNDTEPYVSLRGTKVTKQSAESISHAVRYGDPTEKSSSGE